MKIQETAQEGTSLGIFHVMFPFFQKVNLQRSSGVQFFSLRTLLRVTAPTVGRDTGPAHFSELTPMGADAHESSALRKSRKVVDYFWIPTDQE